MTYRGTLVFAVLLWSGCGRVATGPMQHESVSYDLDKSERVRVDLRMGAGELHVSGGSSRLADADFEYNVDNWKPNVQYHSTGTRGDLEISQPSNPGGFGDVKYRWDVRLNDGVQTDVIAKLGAGEAQMNLGSMNLRTVELEIGAGEVKMDLRGNPKSSYDVRIHGGVGSATVYLPKGVGISATAEGGIGDIDVSGLRERNGRWVNESAMDSPVTVRVEVKGGVGEIKLIAE